MARFESSTPRPVVWLTCRDLHAAGVYGTGNHEPGNLAGFECDCTENARKTYDECQQPVQRQVRGSRIGLRLCCSCESYLGLHVAREFGYRGEVCFFNALPTEVRTARERIVIGRIVRKLLSENGEVGTWSPSRIRRERAEIWRERIARERAGVAA